MEQARGNGIDGPARGMVYRLPVMELTIRPAAQRDVPLILDLIRGLAEYERLAHEVTATEATLRESLFGRKSECIHHRVRRYRLAASPALVLGVLCALQCSLLEHGMTAGYRCRLNVPISTDAESHFNVTLDSCLSCHRWIAGLR